MQASCGSVGHPGGQQGQLISPSHLTEADGEDQNRESSLPSLVPGARSSPDLPELSHCPRHPLCPDLSSWLREQLGQDSPQLCPWAQGLERALGCRPEGIWPW